MGLLSGTIQNGTGEQVNRNDSLRTMSALDTGRLPARVVRTDRYPDFMDMGMRERGTE